MTIVIPVKGPLVAFAVTCMEDGSEADAVAVVSCRWERAPL